MPAFDPENHETLTSILFLTTEGRAALAQNNGALAYDKLSQKHQLILRLFGPTAGPTGTSLVDLAEALHMVGKISEARTAVNDALAIFENLDRDDSMRDRLEYALLNICTRQGHFFEIERIFLIRIERLRAAGTEQDVQRATAQDELAKIYMNQQKFDKALPLTLDSLSIFEQKNLSEDAAVSSLYIARIFLSTNQYSKAESYGQKALDYSKRAHGESSIKTAIMLDELAVTMAFVAQQNRDSVKALEALESSDHALTLFQQLAGKSSKEFQRSYVNNQKLKTMLGRLLNNSGQPTKVDSQYQSFALPTFPFISHSYADDESLHMLLALLPKYVKPVVFEAINVPHTEYVSEKLVSGLLGAEGLIWIDSEVSNNSFWTAFEKDLASRKEKHIFKFDPKTKSITPHKVKPRNLWIAHLYHKDDIVDVNYIIRWLVDERSFEAFNDPEKLGANSYPPFSEIEPSERDLRLFSFRSFGAVYLVFISKSSAQDNDLLEHTLDQFYSHPQSTMLCWLDQPESLNSSLIIDELKHISKANSYSFKNRPSDADFNKHQLDDLMVRLYWLIYQGPGGGIFR